jgi:hypothetical protein
VPALLSGFVYAVPNNSNEMPSVFADSAGSLLHPFVSHGVYTNSNTLGRPSVGISLAILSMDKPDSRNRNTSPRSKIRFGRPMALPLFVPCRRSHSTPDKPFARKAHHLACRHARVLLSGMAVVSAAGRSLAKAGHLPEGSPALFRDLLDHVTQIYHDIATCDTSQPQTEVGAPLRITDGGNVQSAKLSHPPPGIPVGQKPAHPGHGAVSGHHRQAT